MEPVEEADSMSEIQFVEVLAVKVLSLAVDRKHTVTIKDKYVTCCFKSSSTNTALEREGGRKSFIQTGSIETSLRLEIRRKSRKNEVFEAPLSFGHNVAGSAHEFSLSVDPDIRVEFNLGTIRSAMDVAQERGVEAEEALRRVSGSMHALEIATSFLEFFVDIGSPVAEIHPAAKMAFGIGKDAITRIANVSKEYQNLRGAALDCIGHLRFDDEAKRVFRSTSIQNVYKTVMDLTLKTLGLVSTYYSKSLSRRIISREADVVSEIAKALDRERQALPNLFAAEIRAFMEKEAAMRKAEDERAEAARKLAAEAEERRNREKDEVKLRELLCAADSLQYGKIQCLPGTRTVILDQLREWSEDDDISASRLFWLYGVAGCGKSTIASSVAHSLDDQGRLAGSFFCKRDEDQRRSVTHLLGQLALYLARTCVTFRHALLDIIDKPDFKTVKDPKAYFDFVLTKPFTLVENSHAATPNSVIVIDALDECNDPAFAAECIMYLVQSASWVKVIMTSRNLPEIRYKLSSLPSKTKTTHDLFDKNARADIRLLLTRELESDGRLKDVADDIKGREDAFVERSQGLFIWMNTMIEFIRIDIGNLATVNKIIDDGALPEAEKGLDMMYSAVVESASTGSDTTRAITRYVLAFVVASSRTRTMSARVIHALLPPKFHVNLITIETILARLSPILTQSRAGVVAVHTSVLDFCSNISRCDESMWMDSRKVDRELALGCLDVMLRGTRNPERHPDTRLGLRFNICKFDSAYTDSSRVSGFDERVERCISAELKYSSLNWIEHVLKGWVDDTGSEEVCDFIKSLLESEKSLFWLEVVHLTVSIYKAPRFCELSDRSVFFRFKDILLAIDYFARFFRFESFTRSIPQFYTSLTWIYGDSPLRIHWKAFAEHFHVLKGIGSANDSSETTLESRSGSNSSVAFSPDTKHIISGSDDRTARIWSAATGQQRFLLTHPGKVSSVAFSPNGNLVATYCGDSVVRLWDAFYGKELQSLLDEDGLASYAFSPDRETIVMGTRHGSLIWRDISSGREIERLKSHDGLIWRSACSPDGSLIASADLGGSVRLWNAQTKRLVGEIDVKEAWGLVFSPDGQQLAVSGWYNTREGDLTRQKFRDSIDIESRLINTRNVVHVWDVTGQDLKKRYALESVKRIVFSPEGKYIYVPCDDSIHCCDARTGEEVGHPLFGHSSLILSIAISIDGTRIATGARDGIRIWDTSTFHAEVDLSLVQLGTRGADNIPVKNPNDGWLRASDGEPLLWVPRDFRRPVCDASLLQIHERKKPVRIDWEKLFRVSGRNWPGTLGVEGK